MEENMSIISFGGHSVYKSALVNLFIHSRPILIPKVP